MAKNEDKGGAVRTSAESKPAESKPAVESKASGYVVAPRRSITSRRGLIDAGEEVRAEDFAGGSERLDELVKAGAVVKR